MIVTYLLFALGLLCLIKGGDWFVDGATGLAKRFHIPELLIGATVVSIGTTLPEVMVSAGAALKGSSDIAYGNAIGSIICNTALISAITITASPSKVERKTFVTPVIFFFIAAVFYCAIAYFTGYFSRLSGVILLLMFIIYMVVVTRQAIKESGMRSAEVKAEKPEAAPEAGEPDKKETPLWKEILFLVLGAAVIAIGADLLVDNGILIAEHFGVPQTVIALTFVALGTSLPELVTAITSLIKGHSALSLGNIIGANLFNLVFVSGLATTLSPFKVPAGKLTPGGLNASLVIDIPVMFFVMAFMTVPALKKEKLYRFQGIVLLMVYAAFIVFQFVF